MADDFFSQEVVGALKYYVYRLIDPRNGETFYVGKGQGNRVFSHVRAESTKLEGDADDIDNKMGKIREIINAGLTVVHVIHRHGMDEATAYEVEAALIDAYPGISNVVGGRGSGDRGAMHATEINHLYSSEPAKFQHRALLINVARTAEDLHLLEATRYAWKIDPTRAKQAEVVLATRRGLIIGVFIAKKWMVASEENFPDRHPEPGRLGFDGEEAPEAIRKLYLDKRVPDEYRKRGAANPVRYTW